MLQRVTWGLCVLMLMSMTVKAVAADGVQVDPNLKEYQKVEGVSGNLNSIGSDTLNNLMAMWAEEFKKVYPNVNIQIEGKGSTTAPPALINGTSQLGPMSREMKATEADEFEKKFGYKPSCVKVAVDALGVFVHKDNPVAGLSLQEVDAIFSKTINRKYNQQNDQGQPIKKWSKFNKEDDWKDKEISLYGRNSASGTYGYFKEHALLKGDFKDEVKEQPGSAAVVQGVSTDKYGIGYSGIGYVTAGVRALPLSVKGNKYIAPTSENCYNGTYPLSRFLFIYYNRAPGKPVDKLTGEFLKFVISKGGQEITVKDGYFPIPSAVADEDKKALD
ncbi:MAG: PstS family phosphate ABC transporter substrate-binding protein [Planctomycetota bacterium]|nr:PstS family phosphate ABC transporter substrate-binding protein [Planctomycetota bacterium]